MSRTAKRSVKTKKKTAKKKTSPRSFISASASLAMMDQVWPMERDVLFRPDRFRYVRKLVKPKGCVFCHSSKGKAPDFSRLCVYRTKHSMIILNKYPYNSGHLLVLPRRHCGSVLKLRPQEWRDLHETLRKAFAAIEKVYQPAGINMGLNHGAVAGAGIPEHLHFHLIPRWAGDLNFFPLVADTKVVIESLEQSFERYWNYFKKEKK